MRRLRLSGKYSHRSTLIDDEDYELASKYKWYWNGTRSGINNNNHGKCIYLSRLVMGFPKGKQVDHINHNIFDNRKANLRICTNSQNCINKAKYKGTTSKYKGVCKVFNTKTDRIWKAQIMFQRKKLSIGHYTTEKDAAKAYNQKAKELFGEFALLNNI